MIQRFWDSFKNFGEIRCIHMLIFLSALALVDILIFARLARSHFDDSFVLLTKTYFHSPWYSWISATQWYRGFAQVLERLLYTNLEVYCYGFRNTEAQFCSFQLVADICVLCPIQCFGIASDSLMASMSRRRGSSFLHVVTKKTSQIKIKNFFWNTARSARWSLSKFIQK